MATSRSVLDALIAQHPGLSVQQAAALVMEDCVSINGCPVRRPGQLVLESDQVEIMHFAGRSA
ncbi:S4 domain-containing protein [Rhodococcus sp. IEGM 1379]|uniref:RNA-binding S4 domain-containing protein n=1 Tax=Rhodococcus sp. IEGM 1379 TaxID=3047086 RepID=UPI0024B7DDB7|nr:S4 domain-containing protein [Rhodococcus sp. IEGM 1379]MDI9914492.1 S4 domain-containing protein [Rhodococcus sp. IEGM 1379]